MNFLLGLFIVIILFYGTYYSPKMNYFENYMNRWGKNTKYFIPKDNQGVLYSGRAWLGKHARWAPAFIDNKYIPI